MLKSRRSSPDLLRLIPSDGDFSHTRRKSVSLACGCTCCCFIFLGGFVGTAAGFGWGMVRGIIIMRRDYKTLVDDATSGDRWRCFFKGLVRLLVLVAAYTGAGVLIGAGIGYGVDVLAGYY